MAGVSFSGGAVSVTTSPTDNMVHGTQYSHYLRDDIAKPTPCYHERLLSEATNKVVIWDPYFHAPDTAIFRGLKNAVEVYVLSSKSKPLKDIYLDALIAETPNHLIPRVKSHCTFNFGFIDTCKYGKELWNTHDRFLIVDDKYYLVGASVAHHLASHDSTGICRLRFRVDKQIVQNAFDKCWTVCVNDLMYKTKTL